MTIALSPESSTITGVVPEVLRRYRLAISLMFAIAGMTIGTWTARIPTIQHNIKMADAKLSICLLLLAAGGLLGMRAAGRLIDRHGSTTVMVLPSLALGGALLLAGHAPTWTTLAAALLTFGVLHGTLNVAMNAAAVSCQTAYGRPIMTSFHALFSIGGVAGALVSAACAHIGLSVADAFAAVGVVSTAAAGWAIHRLIPAPVSSPDTQESTATAAPAQRRPRTRILLLGVLAFSALISEGAAADWASTYLARLGATPAMAATAYAAFAASMTIGRLVGDRLTAAIAPAALLRGCGLIGGGGLALGLIGGTPATAIAGFACLGAGLSCVVPLLYSTAGGLDPARPGAALSQVAALGYLGYVTGPAIIGGAAMHIGLGNALLILPALATLLVIAAPVVQSSRGRHHRRRTNPRSHHTPVPVDGDDMTTPDHPIRTPEVTTDHSDHQVLELEGALR
ncbi:MFS transporter [Paractinoplanes ferrugineus]|uniref:MFS transporter n=1 Tax=Paractinoplanes ferrugineus TaxID=113564 RepID=A0A919J991_9ACTN|nr:MFS transporter [Actinoplanes ferrugineus]GIE15622.1 MFS transporter [Actinoplanes ferrugineus]